MINKPTTILVTGCAGFIGSNFIKQISQRYSHIKIVGIDNFSTGRRESLIKGIDFYEGSILDCSLLDKIFKKHTPNYVFHFAALPRVSYSVEHPRQTSEANIIGTVALLDCSRRYGVNRFIYSSSSSVYGGAKILPTAEKDNPPNPKSPYALQKYVGEPFCKIFSDLYGLDTVCLRYFNVFGPGQFGDSPYSTVISAWLEALYYPKSKTAFIEGDGSQSRDFCFVDSVVEANVLAMIYPKKLDGEVFNIAHGERTDLNTVKDLLEKYTKKKLNLQHRSERMGDVKHTHADISKARTVLGYEPVVMFEEGLKRTVEWFIGRDQ